MSLGRGPRPDRRTLQQLTAIGRFDQAIVEREVRRGTFVIRTKHGGTKVSWSVTGLRRDAYVQEHPRRTFGERPLDGGLFPSPSQPKTAARRNLVFETTHFENKLDFFRKTP